MSMWSFILSGLRTQEGYNESSQRHFQHAPHESFVRELIQNSLDVRRDSQNPVCLTFKQKKILSSDPQLHMESLLGVLRAKRDFQRTQGRNLEVEDYDGAIHCLEQLEIPILHVSEANTKGMKGIALGTNFYAFTYGNGIHTAVGPGGGTHGIGKAALRLMSSANLFFFSSAYRDDDGPQPQGQDPQDGEIKYLAFGIVRASTDFITTGENRTENRSAWGYWCANEASDPVQNFNEIPDWFRRNEGSLGTDFAIIGYDPKKNISDIDLKLYDNILPSCDVLFAYFVCKNFYKAICDGALKVELCNPPEPKDSQENTLETKFYQNGVWVINKDNIEGHLKILYDAVKRQPDQEEWEGIQESIEETLLSIWCLNEDKLPGYDKQRKDIEVEIEHPEGVPTIINCYVRTITQSPETPNLGERLFDIKTKELTFVRRGFVITKKFPRLKQFSTNGKNFFGVFYLNDPFEIIASCEPPAHDAVDVTNAAENRRDLAKIVIKKIAEGIREFIVLEINPPRESGDETPWIRLQVEGEEEGLQEQGNEEQEIETNPNGLPVVRLRPVARRRTPTPIEVLGDDGQADVEGRGDGEDAPRPGDGDPIQNHGGQRGGRRAQVSSAKIVSVVRQPDNDRIYNVIISNDHNCRLTSIEFKEQGQFDAGASVPIVPLPAVILTVGINTVVITFAEVPPKTLGATLVTEQI